MTEQEYRYLFGRHWEGSADRGSVPAYVNGVSGFIVLPDDWDRSTYGLNYSADDFSSNMVSSQDWESIFEEAGAVFMPFPWGNHGYWTSSCGTAAWSAYSVYWHPGLRINDAMGRNKRFMVRLVHDAE